MRLHDDQLKLLRTLDGRSLPLTIGRIAFLAFGDPGAGWVEYCGRTLPRLAGFGLVERIPQVPWIHQDAWSITDKGHEAIKQATTSGR